MIVSDLLFPRLGTYFLIAAHSLEEKAPKDNSEDLKSSRGCICTSPISLKEES